MAKRPELAKSELEVAQIVWQLGKATVREVLAQLPTDRGLDFKTVQTYLRRLESKGYLTSLLDGRTRVYRTKAKPQNVVRTLIDDFVQRVFQGETLPLVQSLIQDRNLSTEDLQRLRDLLDDELENTP
ncbi:MAG: BlaI/MecI/CopY family transcriptional regulator [Planctomycetales bacterium]|nr:BlaI/MecI/CopY family transcriptional regulator [Planctomycetales bacterium]MCA9170438.1 BlaI/MecI/CopY family transcriptional regulator [Planctomycetales bacterium]